MSLIGLFLAYAKDFELTYRDDDWSRLAHYFAEDAVYQVADAPFACRVVGRDAIFRAIKKSLDGFDRRVGQRKIEVLAPPTENADQVAVHWAVTYRLGENPPLRVSARTLAKYAEGKILYLEDRYDAANGGTSLLDLQALDPTLDPSYV